MVWHHHTSQRHFTYPPKWMLVGVVADSDPRVRQTCVRSINWLRTLSSVYWNMITIIYTLSVKNKSSISTRLNITDSVYQNDVPCQWKYHWCNNKRNNTKRNKLQFRRTINNNIFNAEKTQNRPNHTSVQENINLLMAQTLPENCAQYLN